MRPGRALSVLLLLAAAAPAIRAEPLELGGFFGPRRFADDVVLGADGQGRTSLGGSVVLGPRVARPLLSWLVPELELALSPTTTDQYDVSVFWLEPRALVRLELRPGARVRPFVAVGAGMATALSSKRAIYDSGITVDGFGALDVAFVDDWAAAHERDRLSPARPAATLPDFGLGEAPARVHALAANTTVGDVLARVRSADARTNFLRLLYLLIECEYVSAS